MPAPIVSYFNAAGTAPITEWDIGEIDAGNDSPHLTVTVWNNKFDPEADYGVDEEGNSNYKDVSHMKNVKVTVVNKLGGTSGDPGQSDVVVSQSWFKVIVNPTGDTAVDRTKTKALGYNIVTGKEQFADVNAIGVDPEDEEDGGYMIKGMTNDGTIAGATENYAKYELWVSVPSNAPAGEKQCRIRTSYSYT